MLFLDGADGLLDGVVAKLLLHQLLLREVIAQTLLLLLVLRALRTCNITQTSLDLTNPSIVNTRGLCTHSFLNIPLQVLTLMTAYMSVFTTHRKCGCSLVILRIMSER